MGKSCRSVRLRPLAIIGILIYTLLLGLNTPAALAASDIKLILNGVQTDPTVGVYVDSNNRTMVPLRFIMESMGARVDWLAAEKGIEVTREAVKLTMWVGSSRAYVNGQEITLDTTPVIKDNSTMVPVRFVSQAFGGTPEWDAASGTVSIRLGTPANSDKVRITGSFVNFRTTPEIAAGNIIEVLPRGTVLNYITANNDWYQVRTSSGRSGWVAKEYAELVQVNTSPPVEQKPPDMDNSGPSPGSQPPQLETAWIRITGSFVNVRSGPGIGHPVLDVIPRGTTLGLAGVSGEWYQVQLNSSRTGWVSKDWAEPVAGMYPLPGNGHSGNISPDEPQQPDNSPQGLAIIGTKNVAVLAGPSPVEAQVGIAVAGSRLPIWQRQGNWLLVEMPDGQRGWLAASLATVGPYQPVPGEADKRLKITAIEARQSDAEIEVVVTANRTFSYTTSRWDNRIIIDISGATLDIPPGQEVIEVRRAPLLRIRTSQFAAGTVRIVFDLGGAAALTSAAAGDGLGLVFQLREPTIAGTRIVIDPGHGTDPDGLEPGAIGRNGTMEKDVNLAISLKLAELLRTAGAIVYMTRSSETLPYTLAERAYYANDLNADIFISVHANGSTSADKSGTSTYFYAPYGNDLGEQRGERQRLANSIQKALLTALGRQNMGVHEENFSVLRNTLMPSVLVEVAFISNPAEEMLLCDPAFQAKAAQGIFNGIADYISSN